MITFRWRMDFSIISEQTEGHTLPPPLVTSISNTGSQLHLHVASRSHGIIILINTEMLEHVLVFVPRG